MLNQKLADQTDQKFDLDTVEGLWAKDLNDLSEMNEFTLGTTISPKARSDRKDKNSWVSMQNLKSAATATSLTKNIFAVIREENHKSDP